MEKQPMAHITPNTYTHTRQLVDTIWVRSCGSFLLSGVCVSKISWLVEHVHVRVRPFLGEHSFTAHLVLAQCAAPQVFLTPPPCWTLTFSLILPGVARRHHGSWHQISSSHSELVLDGLKFVRLDAALCSEPTQMVLLLSVLSGRSRTRVWDGSQEKQGSTVEFLNWAAEKRHQ